MASAQLVAANADEKFADAQLLRAQNDASKGKVNSVDLKRKLDLDDARFEFEKDSFDKKIKIEENVRSAELANDKLKLENEKAKHAQDFELAKSAAEAASKNNAAQAAMMQQMMADTAATMQQMIAAQTRQQDV